MTKRPVRAAPEREGGPGTLERYTRIMEVVVGRSEPLSLTEIRDFLDLPKGSVHRLLKTLTSVGWLDADGGSRNRYRLGQRLQRLLLLGNDHIVRELCAQPVLERLVAQVNETCFIARLCGGGTAKPMVIVAPQRGLRGFISEDILLPPHAAASAKSILAFQPQEVIDAALSGPFERFTSRTKTEHEDIMEDYSEIRRLGYATCLQEMEEGLAGISVPVLSPGVGVLYCVAATGPYERVSEKTASAIVPLLRKAAEEFSQALARKFRHRAKAAPSSFGEDSGMEPQALRIGAAKRKRVLTTT